MSDLPYPTQLRNHLAASKRAGVKWEKAWPAALHACEYVSDDGEGWPIEFTRQAFRDAYCGLTAPSRIGAIAERDRMFVGHRYEAPGRPRGVCGWGGRGGCDKPSEPWLCAKHGLIVRACRGALCLHAECHETGSPNNAVLGTDYCERHTREMAAA